MARLHRTAVWASKNSDVAGSWEFEAGERGWKAEELGSSGSWRTELGSWRVCGWELGSWRAGGRSFGFLQVAGICWNRSEFRTNCLSPDSGSLIQSMRCIALSKSAVCSVKVQEFSRWPWPHFLYLHAATS